MVTFDGGERETRNDPLYAAGMLHLQSGEWGDAIRVFEELQRRYPDNAAVQSALEEARFKASFDENGRRVRARRWTIRLGPILFRLAVVAVVALLIYVGAQALNQRIAPLVAQAKEERRIAQLLTEGDAFLLATDLDSAKERYASVLESEPANLHAVEGLAEINRQQDIKRLYEEAVAAESAGDYQAALASYQELELFAPSYLDTPRRIASIEQRLSISALYEAAEADYGTGRFQEAMRKYEELRVLNASYQQERVSDRLYELYMQAGREILQQDPPALEQLPDAMGYFTKALALSPRSQEAGLEQQLVRLFLAGQSAYYEENWDEAILNLQVVFDTRPNYLGDTVLQMLYESYVRSGDQYNQTGDTSFAYERYRKASQLPVEDKVWAQGRLYYIEPLLTPTPTPLPTATPRAQVAGPPATPRPLSAYQGKIIYLSDYQYRGELWIMDPDGQNRQRLGRDWALRAQYEELREAERYAPDRSRFAFVQNPANSPHPQVYVTIPVNLRQEGGAWFMRLTYHEAMCYDPVWSPDGKTIAFVSCIGGSDDIWLIDADVTDPRPLMSNAWEWDRHPSWSADSSQIVFWSNRTGIKQLYTMKTDGTGVVNISNSTWDEYDPIWIK